MTDQPNWTSLTRDQKGEAIRPYIEAGKLTYAQIAQMFGTTKNSISSTVARNGLVNPLTAGDKSLTPMQKAEKARMLRAKVNKIDAERQAKKRRADAKRKSATTRPRPTPDHRKTPHPFVAQHIPEDAIDRRPPKPDAWLPLGPPDQSLALDRLTEHTCKWPVTPDLPFLFCGQHTQEHSPYCPDHHAMAYRPAPEIRLKRKKGTT